MLNNRLWRHGAQIELQTPGENRHRYLLRVSGCQHKFQIFGGFFQRLQHRIERCVGEHVNLIDHEDFKAPLNWFVDRLLQELLHLFDPTVRGCIELCVVYESTRINGQTNLTRTTRLCCDASLAVERLGQYSRHCGLSHTAGSREKVSVVQSLLSQRIAQGLNHVRLPNQLREGFRAVLTG